MDRYKIDIGEGKNIEVNICKTKWIMHAASMRYKRRGLVSNTTHGALGTCYRWWLYPKDRGRTIAAIFLSWDTMTIDVLCHELLHAAIHAWTYEKEDGKILNTSNDEELCYLHSDMVNGMLGQFTDIEKERMLKNG
jgi:hypothetical protein